MTTRCHSPNNAVKAKAKASAPGGAKQLLGTTDVTGAGGAGRATGGAGIGQDEPFGGWELGGGLDPEPGDGLEDDPLPAL